MEIVECNILFIDDVFVEEAGSQGAKHERAEEYHLDARWNSSMDVIVYN